MQSTRVVVLGTGGTMAGSATSVDDNVGYRAGVVAVDALVVAAALPAALSIESEQVAQLDSKDMDLATWLCLAERVEHHLARANVAAVIVTHGTDTLEETAYFLHRVLGPAKPVVLTGAMRPATSRLSDGPQNLADAVVVATAPGAAGVLVAFAGTVHGARDVRKVHPYRLDPFESGDAGPVARVEEGRVRSLRPWPVAAAAPPGTAALPSDDGRWPFVAIVTSSSGADARSVRALVDAGAAGLVVAATGNGTVHRALEAALREAMAAGCAVLRSTRCQGGAIVAANETAIDELPSAGDLPPPQARVELILRLVLGQRDRRGP